jgi:hypothetical protein
MQFIKLPKTSKELRIKHFKALTSPIFNEDKTIFTSQEKCHFVADFIEMDYQHLIADATQSQVDKLFSHVLDLFDNFKPQTNPPNEITLCGKLLERINPEKVGIAWHMDWEQKDINKPIDLACMMYFPKGETYGKLDVNKNMIYPLRERRIWFEQDMKLFTFIEASAFFLRKSNKSMLRYTVIENSKRRTIHCLSKIKNTIGRKR